MDGVRASGNQDIHVKMTPTKRGRAFCCYAAFFVELIGAYTSVIKFTANKTLVSLQCSFLGCYLHDTQTERVLALPLSLPHQSVDDVTLNSAITYQCSYFIIHVSD